MKLEAIKIGLMLLALWSFLACAFLNLRTFYLLWRYHEFVACETDAVIRNFEFGLAIFAMCIAIIALVIYVGEIIMNCMRGD